MVINLEVLTDANARKLHMMQQGLYMKSGDDSVASYIEEGSGFERY